MIRFSLHCCDYSPVRMRRSRGSGPNVRPTQRAANRCAKSPSSYLDTQLHLLSAYAPATQQKLLGIRAQVEFMNEQIAEASHYPRMTFDPSLTDENRRRVEANIDSLLAVIADRAKDTADEMGALIDKENW